MHRHTETVEVAGRTITISELTLLEVRSLFKRLAANTENGEIDVVDFGLFPNTDLITIASMIGDATLDDLTPSQLDKVIEKCREVNQHFFQLRDRMIDVGRKIQEARAATLNELLPS
ncbi:MAG: hypothetical protein HQL07_13010 [Nitrospirae bacterium]|nr:hypothetical protein [Magnetococcales bacterium]